MTAKDTKNIIISIVVLLVGIQLVVYLAKGYIPKDADYLPKDVFSSVSSLANLMTIGLVIILFLALPFYFSRRSDEKKQRPVQ